MIKRFIRNISYVVLVLLSAFLFPSQVSAAIGTHLGVGDINHQISIINNILARNGAGRSFPVTVMVQTNTSSEDVQRLADAVDQNNFFPIVRINRSCSVNPQESQTIVQIVKQAFGNDTVIVFGNEVNNKDRECPDWNQYAQNYRTVQGANISPSALDWYMGNPAFDANLFLNETGLNSDYLIANTRTANAYGCINETTESCDPAATNTQQTGMQGTENKNLYLTEFSLSPGGESPPDRDLNKVIEFIENRGPETGAIQITPLVRNVCENLRQEGEWLLYINGKLYTSEGSKVDPDNCESLQVEFVPRDPNKYFLYPLILQPEKSLNNTGGLVDTLIWNMVMDQGYETHCPGPALRITKDTFGEMKKFFKYNPYPIVMSSEGSYKANLSQTKVPLFRGSEKETLTNKTSSFEGYFGAVSDITNAADETADVVNSGVANSLLTLEQQCNIKVNNLLTAKQMCEEYDGQQTLANPELCALHQKIADTNYYIFSTENGGHQGKKSLLNAYLKADEDGVGCSEFAQSWKPELDIDQDDFEDIQNAIQKMSLNLDSVYRLAFFVIAPLQDVNASNETRCSAPGTANNPQDRFCFLSRHRGSEGNTGKIHTKNIPGKHAPMVVAFKIPDFATNKSYSYELWQDAADITTSMLRSTEINDLVKDKIKEAREELLANTAAQQQINQHGSEEEKLKLVINCKGLPGCDCGHGTGCELKLALVDIVNGNKQTCENTSSPLGSVEDAGDIFSPGQVLPDASREILSPFWLDIPKTQDRGYWQWALKIKNFNDGTQKIQGSDGKQGVQVRTLIVAPVGTNMEYLNEALKIFFTEDGFEQMVKNNCLPDAEGECGLIPKYYPLAEAKFGFNDQDKEHFYDPNKNCPKDEFGFELPWCENRSWGVKLSDKNVGLMIKGAKFGWMIKKIQQTIRASGTATFEYILSCERTEDMFLGRCPGGEAKGIFGEDREFEAFDLCSQITEDSSEYDACAECENRGGLWTAVGCAQTKAESIVRMFVRIGLSIGGGIALLMILISAFELTTSSGDPKKVEEAKSRLTAAIIGLVFIIFSVVILQFIGVSLFRLPGFGG